MGEEDGSLSEGQANESEGEQAGGEASRSSAASIAPEYELLRDAAARAADEADRRRAAGERTMAGLFRRVELMFVHLLDCLDRTSNQVDGDSGHDAYLLVFASVE